FWVTLLWPWLVALGFVALERLRVERPGLLPAVAVLVPLLLLPVLVGAGALKHSSTYRKVSKHRVEDLRCLTQAAPGGGAILCPQLAPFDLRAGVTHATETDASFTRTLHVGPIPIGAEFPAPLLHLSS